jgi:putative endonuclease
VGPAGSIGKHLRAFANISELENDPRKNIGQIGEQIALEYLEQQGHRLVCRNWKCRYGELDLITCVGDLESEEFVFAEVKTRLASALAKRHVLENITRRKQNKLRLLSQVYLNSRFRDNRFPRFRIDVVGVILERGSLQVIDIEHITNAL